MTAERRWARRLGWDLFGSLRQRFEAEAIPDLEPVMPPTVEDPDSVGLVGDLEGGVSAGQAPYVTLSERAREKPLADCLDDFDGFALLARGGPSGGPIPIIEYPTMIKKEWIYDCNERTSRTPDLGCLFAKSAHVYGPGHVLLNGSLLVEDVELSTVAKEWHEKSRPGIRDRKLISVHEPVIAFLGPGHKVYGHWIVDYLPRLFVAKKTLGKDFAKFRLLLPTNTPVFALELCRIFIGDDLQFRFYEEDDHILACDNVCIPTFPVSHDHHFHELTDELFRPHQAGQLGTRKICISRKRIEGRTPGVAKVFPQLKVFEATAELHGYEIVHPEELPLEAQFEMFRQARVIIGQYGSGLHNSIFCAPGAIIGAAGFFNAIQLRLCLMSNQSCAFITTVSENYLDGVLDYICDTVSIAEFFKEIDIAIDKDTMNR